MAPEGRSSQARPALAARRRDTIARFERCGSPPPGRFRAVSSCPETSRSPTGSRSSGPWPRAKRASRTSPRPPTAPRPSAASRRWASRSSGRGRRRPDPRPRRRGAARAARRPSTPATRARPCGCWPASWPAGPSARSSPATSRCCRRPVERVAAPLRAMGARARVDDGKPPLTIDGGALRAIRWELPVASAQVKTAVLLAGLQAEGRTTVREPGPSRDHTERLLPAFGVAGRARRAHGLGRGWRPAARRRD